MVTMRYGIDTPSVSPAMVRNGNNERIGLQAPQRAGEQNVRGRRGRGSGGNRVGKRGSKKKTDGREIKFRGLLRSVLQSPLFALGTAAAREEMVMKAYFNSDVPNEFCPILIEHTAEIGSALVAHADGYQKTVSQAGMLKILADGCPQMMAWLAGRGISRSDWDARAKKPLDCTGVGGLEHLPPQRLLLSRAINQLLSQVGRMGCRVFTRGTSETSASDVLILRQRPPGDPAGSNYVYRVDDRCMLCLSSVAECPNRVLVCGPNRVCPHGHTVCTECKHLRFATCPKCRAPL